MGATFFYVVGRFCAWSQLIFFKCTVVTGKLLIKTLILSSVSLYLCKQRKTLFIYREYRFFYVYFRNNLLPQITLLFPACNKSRSNKVVRRFWKESHHSLPNGGALHYLISSKMFRLNPSYTKTCAIIAIPLCSNYVQHFPLK